MDGTFWREALWSIRRTNCLSAASFAVAAALDWHQQSQFEGFQRGYWRDAPAAVTYPRAQSGCFRKRHTYAGPDGGIAGAEQQPPGARRNAGLLQFLQGIGADGFQQLVAAAFAQLHQERLLHQPGGEISRLGRMLYDRIVMLSSHLSQLGKHLDRALETYNSAVGSYENRVLTAARKFRELGVSPNGELESPPQLERSARRLSGAADEGPPATEGTADDR